MWNQYRKERGYQFYVSPALLIPTIEGSWQMSRITSIQQSTLACCMFYDGSNGCSCCLSKTKSLSMCCDLNGTANNTHTKNETLSSFGNTCFDFEMSAVLTTFLFEHVVIQIGNSYPSTHHFSRAEYSIGVTHLKEKLWLLICPIPQICIGCSIVVGKWFSESLLIVFQWLNLSHEMRYLS